MPILTKEVEIRLWGQNVKYYQSLGYNGKHGDVIVVKVEDLQDGCNASIEYLCDYCNQEVITIVYADFVRRTKEVNKMACKHCYPQKIKETNMLHFGTSSYAKTDEYHKKMEDMMMSKYGVRHYSQTKEYKDKWNKTCFERYGDSYRKKFMDKAFKTFSDKTGYNYPSQSPDTKEKIASTLYANSTILTSKQQRYIFNLYQLTNPTVKLNFPISYYNVDICFPEEKLTIEYDGGFHNGLVKLGRLTQKEFDMKEIIRNNAIKKEGYKQIRIVSSKDFIPLDFSLLQMLNYARQYFSNYPYHSWIEFNIDTSSIRSAEYKDGIYYNYGELRRIKDVDSSVSA